jgi:hypothetical protein
MLGQLGQLARLSSSSNVASRVASRMAAATARAAEYISSGITCRKCQFPKKVRSTGLWGYLREVFIGLRGLLHFSL